jgi:hypothetical protein
MLSGLHRRAASCAFRIALHGAGLVLKVCGKSLRPHAHGATSQPVIPPHPNPPPDRGTHAKGK